MSDYILITAPDCSWCNKAKAALLDRGITYAEFSTTETTIRNLFFCLNVKTVPQIFKAAHGNHPIEYIGGCDDLLRRLDQDEFHIPLNPY